MIKHDIEKIAAGGSFTLTEAYSVMSSIMSGECNISEIAGLLLALRTKGETPEEVAGFAQAMRDKSIRIASDKNNTIDVCGTGGDGSNTFNISTAAAFVVAGAGVKVAKHGNRSVSSKSGSADVLSQIGININIPPDLSEAALNEIGIAFLFAPIYHPAMKYAAPVRKELGIKTVFNILGPLTNPAQTRRQLIGVFDERTAELMAKAAFHLDMEKVSFICTDNRFDEISLTATTAVFEHNSCDGLTNYSLKAESFGYDEIDLEKIKSDSIEKNTDMLLSLLKDKNKDELYRVVAANAALALQTSGFSDNLIECKNAAEESISSGKAFGRLTALKSFGEKYS